MDDALDHVEEVLKYGLKDVKVTKPAANNYQGPLYAPYRKMKPIPGLENYTGETDK